MLTIEAIKELNKQLLYEHAYNPKQYEFMQSMVIQEKLSNKQLYVMVSILNTLAHSRLSYMRKELYEAVKYYKTRLDSINIVNSNNVFVTLQWQFNANLHEELKSSSHNKVDYTWIKSESGWLFRVTKEYLPNITQIFEKHGFNITQLVQEINEAPISNTTISKLTVIRNDTDTLLIQPIPILPEVVSALNKIPHMLRTSKGYKIYIDQALELYDTLSSKVDKSELEEWATLVKSWENQYELRDWKEFPSLPFTPYDFQPTDAKTLLELRRGLNANEVGCGKTFEQILIGESIPKTKLVICPATLRLNWQREILSVNPTAVINILYSHLPYKIVNGWNIISYDSLRTFQSKLEAEMIPVIIADEAHYIQAINGHGSPTSIRAKNVLRLAATAGWVFPVTGTPKTNRNKNVYNILRMIRHPLTRGKLAWKNYCKVFCDGVVNGSSNDDELHSQLVPYMVRHLKRDVLPDLKKQRQAIPVDVDLVEYYKKIKDYMSVREYNDARSLVALNAAKQIIAKQKVHYTIEYAKSFIEQGEKVVIATCYTAIVQSIEKAFNGKCLKIVGGMNDTQKQDTINKFQNSTSHNVIVLNYEAGGVGITLTAAHTMILNDLPWVPGTVSQAEGRIWRSGQTETAIIYFMVANECLMDNIMVNLLVNKSISINNAIDGGIGEEINIRELLDKAFSQKYTKTL